MEKRELTIRRARPEDFLKVDELKAVLLQDHAQHRPDLLQSEGSGYSLEEYREFLAEEDNIALLAEVDGEIAGLCFTIRKDEPEGPVFKARRAYRVEDLAVFPQYRRQGVASALLEETRRITEVLGADYLKLQVWEFNEGARALYEKAGFTTRARNLEYRFPR